VAESGSGELTFGWIEQATQVCVEARGGLQPRTCNDAAPFKMRRDITSSWPAKAPLAHAPHVCDSHPVPAHFMNALCGYRAGGNPNTSDNNDALSKEIGRTLFDVLGVPNEQAGPEDPGAALEEHVSAHLAEVRPDLLIARSRSAAHFEQYAHMAVFPRYRRGHRRSGEALAPLIEAIEGLDSRMERATIGALMARAAAAFQEQDNLAAELLAHMPEEALLKIDITVADQQPQLPRLQVALSSKWSLRTDRAQDCVSQGSKLVAQRRGRMPHFAVITMEPRPSMLKILGDGSGAVDCVYHLHLPALTKAMRSLAEVGRRNPLTWSPLLTFDRLVRQRRLRDYDELVAEVERLPEPAGG
jgi:hypothetical protein